MTSPWPYEVSVGVVLDRVGESSEAIAICVQSFVDVLETRIGESSWNVVGGASWSGGIDELAALVRAHPAAATTGTSDPADGYGFTLSTRLDTTALSVGIDVGGPVLGRRLPAQNVDAALINPQETPVDPDLGDAVLEALIEGWRPLFARLSDADINVAASRGRWKIPAGYRVWLRDGTVTLAWLADGVTARPFAGGTMLSVPDDWPPDLVANRLAETYERNGVDDVPH